MEAINNNENSINYYNFNEDCSFITLGTKTGFKIVNLNPPYKYFERKFGLGIGIIEMYKKSNILTLTGCEKNSKFPENALIIWDENKGEIIKEMRIIHKIRIIKIINNFLFLVNDIKLYIFNFPSLNLFYSIEIYSFQKELISFNINKDIKIAFLKSENTINLMQINKHKKEKNNEKKIILIKDEKKEFIYLKFNTKGDILSVIMNNSILLYNTLNGDLIKEIYNDNLKDKNINCIQFSENDKYMAISTTGNNARINIFDIEEYKQKSIFDFFWGNEIQCFAYYKLNSEDFIFSFNENNDIIIIQSNGEFYKIILDKINGGYCKKFT